ncbi:MAG: hypothetical protein WC962_06300 [Phycisphaerae bacterium]|jgi:hypothetical protein
MDEPKTKRTYTRKKATDAEREARIEKALAKARTAKVELPPCFTEVEAEYADNHRDIEDATNANLARHYERLKQQEAK